MIDENYVALRKAERLSKSLNSYILALPTPRIRSRLRPSRTFVIIVATSSFWLMKVKAFEGISSMMLHTSSAKERDMKLTPSKSRVTSSAFSSMLERSSEALERVKRSALYKSYNLIVCFILPHFYAAKIRRIFEISKFFAKNFLILHQTIFIEEKKTFDEDRTMSISY